jgi:hypothetical protein
MDFEFVVGTTIDFYNAKTGFPIVAAHKVKDLKMKYHYGSCDIG